MAVSKQITMNALFAFALVALATLASCSPKGSDGLSPAASANNGEARDFAQSTLAVNPPPDIPSDFADCSFNGQTISHGSSINAFQNSTVTFGSLCVEEKRICNNGALSGSFQYASCSADTPASCLFNGQTIAHGQSVQAFGNSNVAFDQICQSEIRTCSNGILSGTSAYASCQVDAAASCLFNGQTVAHGQSVTAFQNSTQAYGSQCKSEQRMCSNGSMSGSYQYGSCNVDVVKSCLFNGQTIAHGQSVQAFPTSSVSFGSNCISDTRTCNDGVLSGTNQFATCAVAKPASCLFNGQTIAHNQVVNAFETSTVGFGGSCSAEERLCYNGILDGSNQYASCTVNQPASCLINGLTIAHGQSTILFQSASVPVGQSCVQQSRTCSNGQLSGSYTFGSCETEKPKFCEFNGQTLSNGEKVTAFLTDSVAFGETCLSEIRTCTDGVLSGSNTFSSCQSAAPKSCSFGGQTIAHGKTVEAFLSANVAYGQSCQSEIRSCSNGVLSGSNSNLSCTVAPAPVAPKACFFNGKSVAHGETIKAFKAPKVSYGLKCESESRTCNDGQLSGTFTSTSCTIEGPKSCKILFGLITIPHGFTIWSAAKTTMGGGNRCEAEITFCNNGQFVIDPSLTCQHGDKPPVTIPPPKPGEPACEIDPDSNNGAHIGVGHGHNSAGAGWYKGDKPCKAPKVPTTPPSPTPDNHPCKHIDDPRKPCAHKKNPKNSCDYKAEPKKK